MFEEISQETRTIFLLKFTKELIINSKGTELYRLEEIIRRRVGLPSLFKETKTISKEKIDERIKEVLSKKFSKTIEQFKEPSRKITPLPKNQQNIISLTVPRLKFQESSQHLSPPPAPGMINFGKIEILIKDPNVKIIEFQSENQKIVVEGNMGRKFTGIGLTQEDSKNLLNEFSKKAKIPINNGINKIAIGNFLITAIVSENKINHFLIKKISETSFTNLRPPTPNY
jgi:hypothetical protein